MVKTNSPESLVAKIWSFCDTLRDDGVSYGDYLEQITYLLFLKMADESSSTKNYYKIPLGCDWKSLYITDVTLLINKYSKSLKKLANAGGMLTKIFTGAQNKIHDQNKLRKLIELINQENWISESFDIKGDIYESLLQKNAENSGAGQYFTPRPIIQAMVACISPKPKQTISDPSCGTGGFFLGALNYLRTNYKLTPTEKNVLKFKTFHGWEIVPSTARLCLMNLFLHGIGDLKTTPEIDVVDSLKDINRKKVDIVFANPPFGKTSSDIITNDEKKAKLPGYYYRKDIWVTTSNKQLAFLQHIVSMLDKDGKAAVVLPDNILFEAGSGEIVRKKLLETVDLHTILRLPTGIFYAQGVKANILFFEMVKKTKKPATKEVWIYDYRTNVHHTLKKNSLQFEDLKDFIKCYNVINRKKRKETWSEKNDKGRWKKFTYDQIVSRDKVNLDIFWLRENNLLDLENLPDPDTLIDDIIEDIESALSNFKTIKDSIN